MTDARITKEKAVEILLEMMTGYATFSQRIAIGQAIQALKQPERIKAKWKIDWDWGIATCTNCQHDYDDADKGYLIGGEMRFCPFCGAEIEEKL